MENLTATDDTTEQATPRARRSVYVIDDDSHMRQSLHFLLASCDIDAWPFAGCPDFIEQLPQLAPAPIMLDIRMPSIDGLEMLGILRERAVSWPVIIMTAHGDVTIAVRAMKLGAIDFLEKPFRPELLDIVLDQAFSQLDRMEHSVRMRNEARSLIALLSKRESQIVAILLEGAPNKEVAHRLGLSIRTVEMHRGNALAKLKVRSVAEVIALIGTADLGPQGLESLVSGT